MLNFKIRGTGAPMLMCNGLGASTDTWGTFGDILAANRTLIMFDAPGCGDSPLSWHPYSMGMLANAVVRHVRDLGFGMVDCTGFSFGGVLAQQIAHQFPEVVNRLTLVSTLSGEPALTAAPHVMALACNPWRFVSSTVAERVAPILYGGESLAFRGNRPSLIGVAHQIGAVASWFGVRGIKSPTLVIGGTNDPLTPVENVAAIVNRIPGARGIEIEGAGHLWLLNEPEAAAKLVTMHTTSNQENAA